MIQFDQKALRECIKDAIREELQPFISKIRGFSDTERNGLPERLLTKREMADELDISLVSLTEWMKNGRIPYMRMGKRVYFRKREVLESMEGYNRKDSSGRGLSQEIDRR